jgi:hypothetical protein
MKCERPFIVQKCHEKCSHEYGNFLLSKQDLMFEYDKLDFYHVNTS